ncbi:hypothetical protein [Sphingomonas aquatilis]|nr:hypothetical protein [Sphingomonas aquatilis]MCI4653093.1 hypothetical protein [Sphingomonas aquatilis]
MPPLVSPFIGFVALSVGASVVLRYLRQDRAIRRMRRAQQQREARRG